MIHRSPRTWRNDLLTVILLFSVVLRIVAALYLGNSVTETRGGTYDQISYDLLARQVADGHGFTFPTDWWPLAKAGEPTAFWSYLYTVLLALLYRLAGHSPLLARLVQAVAVGLLTPWLTFRVAKRAMGEWVGFAAAAISSVYLYFVTYAASLMTEAFYIVAILWTLDAAMRMMQCLPAPPQQGKKHLLLHGFELGAAMGITMLLRQAIVGFWAVLAIWLVFTAWRSNSLRRLWIPALVATVTLILVLSPAILHNYHLFHRLTMPNTNAGIAFFWANHPVYGTRFEAVLSPEHGVTYQELIPPELRDLDEAALDRALLLRGLQFIVDDPVRYVKLCLSRIPVYFLFWPTADSTTLSNLSRVLSFGLCLPFMALGVLLALRSLVSRPSRPAPVAAIGTRGVEQNADKLHRDFVSLLLFFCLTYSLIHLASWANVRYRLPVDAVLIMFAAYALQRLWVWCNLATSHSTSSRVAQ